MKVDGTYISVWDDGYSDVETDVVVDLDDMKIIEWDYSKTTYNGEAKGEEDLNNLCEEYVQIGKDKYTAMRKDEYEDFGKDDEEYYDEYKNGIITYE